MGALVLYYSYSGHTKKIAEEIASKESADIVEVKDAKRPGTFKAYTAGSIAAMRGKAWPIQPLSVDFAKYDKITLLAPIWAGNPAPEFNAMLELIPAGKDVAIKMVSGGGKSKCRAQLEAIVENKGCALESFEDIKG